MATYTPPKWATDAFRSFGPDPVRDRTCWSASRRPLGAKKLTVAGTSHASPVPAPLERRRIKEMEAVVVEVVRETPDTTTLVLFTGNERLDYEAGHFLTVDPHQFEGLERFVSFFEDLKGRKEPPRAYSMSSAPHERYITITVKEERYISAKTKYPPLLSPLLVRRTPRGTRMMITGFTGPHTKRQDFGKDESPVSYLRRLDHHVRRDDRLRRPRHIRLRADETKRCAWGRRSS